MRMEILLIGMCALMWALIGTTAATTWCVGGDAGADFTGIQDAVDAASEGDTIAVDAGTYNENVNIAKSVTLQGKGADCVTVHAANPDEHIFKITASGVNISGFTITGAGDYSAGIYLDAVNHCNITENNITNNNGGGMYLSHASSSIIANNNISNNYYGIFLDSCNGNVFDSNIISDSFNGDGISMDSSMSNTLVDNTIESNAHAGIGFWSSSDNLAYHNNLINNSGNGYDGTGTNSWDNGSEGNYWSDYEEKYPDAGEVDDTGVWDTPYKIPEETGAKDNYPFIEEDGWIPEEDPFASFTYSPEYPIVDEPITFDASSSHDPDGTITNYEWDFDDGNTTNTSEPVITHSYSSADDYVVDLTVTDDDGLTNLITKDISVTEERTENFTISEGWNYEDKLIDEPYLFDVTVVRLDDGRYRLYGELGSSPEREVVSYISDDGVNFQKEDGYRLTEVGFMPFVVKLADGRFRLYFTGEESTPESTIETTGYKAIQSAISENGLNFTIEDGDRLAYTGSGYEYLGIRDEKILRLSNGSYRMYYHGIDENEHWRVLSALSHDGLNWTREEGVRLDPSDLCNYTYATGIGNMAPVITSDGIYHLYVCALVCDGGYGVPGIFDATSTDGLTFTVNNIPVITGYATESNRVGPEDPAVIMTDEGFRMYFAAYGSGGIVISESGIYSIIQISDAQVRGDLNCDGKITLADVAIALEIAAGSRPCDAVMLAAADVSGDGQVTSLDALMILQAAVNSIEL
ncbi:MAG: right-handed parallel beta-helix repeat-containing protein [Methanosarcinales archaeon]|nr:right-handed parallel beta-helix repeat-containing protein [Methanosarcinales archaeon]